MKNFMNYICLFLMILGINVSVNAESTADITITTDAVILPTANAATNYSANMWKNNSNPTVPTSYSTNETAATITNIGTIHVASCGDFGSTNGFQLRSVDDGAGYLYATIASNYGVDIEVGGIYGSTVALKLSLTGADDVTITENGTGYISTTAKNATLRIENTCSNRANNFKYIKITPKEQSKYTLTYLANGAIGDAPAAVTDKYENDQFALADASTLTMTGSIFKGWKSNVEGDTKIYIAGETYTMPDQDVEMTAQWQAVTNFQTYCPRTVSFDLNGLQGETPASILTKKNQTITNPGDPVTPVGTDFLGWYNGDTKWNFETDVVTEDVQLSAKCQSALVISGDVHLTSGNGVQVYTTPATNNMITVSWFGKDVAEATKIRFSYYLNDKKVESTNSPFRVCDATTYNFITSNVNNEGENFEQTFAVSYEPTAYNQLDNYTIRVEAVNSTGNTIYRSADLAVYGRSLPEKFALVMKIGKQWYAVSNSQLGTSSEVSAPEAVPVEVEMEDNVPVAVALLNRTNTDVVYSAAARQKTSEHRGAIRFYSAVKNGYITATKTDHPYFYMPNTNNEAQQFYLNSTDMSAYTITLDPEAYTYTEKQRCFSVNGKKIGWFETQNNTVYILPISDTYVRELTNDQIGTLCLPFDVKAENFSGADFYEMSYKELDAQGNPFRLYYEEQVETLTAGKAYIFVPQDDRIVCKKEADAEIDFESFDSYNGLVGTFDTIMPTEDNVLVGKYMVVNNIFQKCGINCGLLPYRAYIDMNDVPTKEQLTQAPTRRLLIMGKDRIEYADPTPGISTGSDRIKADEVIQKLIINEKLVIKRGGRIYNAAGALMK